MTHISILLVNYDGQEDTVACLRSLTKIKHAHFSYSVMIVDNGSKAPLNIPDELQADNLHLLRSDANLGFTEGNNLAYNYAVEHVHPDFVLLLNNDTIVEPHFLEEMLTCAQQNERIGLVTPKIYFSPGREFHHESYQKAELGKVFWYAGGALDWRNLDAFHRGVDEVDRGQFDTQTESDFATGCAVLIPKKIIDEVGFFKLAYFLYLEDVDFSMRVKLAGHPIYFCPAAVVWHKNAGSSGGAGSTLHQYYQTRNRLYFFFNYGALRTKLTTLNFAFRLLIDGNTVERNAVLDWALGRMGKKPLL